MKQAPPTPDDIRTYYGLYLAELSALKRANAIRYARALEMAARDGRRRRRIMPFPKKEDL